MVLRCIFLLLCLGSNFLYASVEDEPYNCRQVDYNSWTRKSSVIRSNLNQHGFQFDDYTWGRIERRMCELSIKVDLEKVVGLHPVCALIDAMAQYSPNNAKKFVDSYYTNPSLLTEILGFTWAVGDQTYDWSPDHPTGLNSLAYQRIRLLASRRCEQCRGLQMPEIHGLSTAIQEGGPHHMYRLLCIASPMQIENRPAVSPFVSNPEALPSLYHRINPWLEVGADPLESEACIWRQALEAKDPWICGIVGQFLFHEILNNSVRIDEEYKLLGLEGGSFVNLLITAAEGGNTPTIDYLFYTIFYDLSRKLEDCDISPPYSELSKRGFNNPKAYVEKVLTIHLAQHDIQNPKTYVVKLLMKLAREGNKSAKLRLKQHASELKSLVQEILKTQGQPCDDEGFEVYLNTL